MNRTVGDRWGEGLGQVEDVERTIFAPRNVDLRQSGLLKLTEAEDQNLLRVLERRARPMNQRVETIAQQVRTMTTEDARDYVSRGARVVSEPVVRDPNTGALARRVQWKPFAPVQNYAPRMLDPRRIARIDVKSLATQLRAVNRGGWLSEEDALQAATALRAQALGQPIPGFVREEIVRMVRGHSFLPGHLHARTRLMLPDTVLRPMKEAIPIYLEQSARERGFLQVFGASADDQFEQIVQQIGPRNQEMHLATEVWDRFRGRFIEAETGRRLKQTAHILNNLASATLLGFTTAVVQISQFGAVIGRLGLRNVAKGLTQVAFQGGRLRAERAGAFVNSLADELRRVTQLAPTATKTDILEQQTARAVGAVVRFSGIKTMDEFPRAVGFHAARIALEDARRAAVLGNQTAVRMLREVGLTAESTVDDLAQAAASLSRRLNVTANFADLPLVLQTPVGAFARGLNTFNIAVVRMVQREFLAPVGRAISQRNPRDLAQSLERLSKFAVTSLALGEIIGETRRGLAGRRGDRPGGTIEEFIGDLQRGIVPSKVIWQRVGDELAWSGTLGILQGMWQSMQFAMSGTEKGARLVGTLTGAGVSSAGEVAGAGRELLLAATARGEEAETERLRRLRTSGRIGARRLPAVGGIVAPRLFRSALADRRVAIQTAARALLRGDEQRATRTIEEFERRHGKTISDESLDKAIESLRR